MRASHSMPMTALGGQAAIPADLFERLLMAHLCPWCSGSYLHLAAPSRKQFALNANIAAELAPTLEQAPPEAVLRAVERTPSLTRYPVGMASPKVRTAMRTGEIASWDLDCQCAVAASLGHRVEILLVPPGMRAVVAFEPA